MTQPVYQDFEPGYEKNELYLYGWVFTFNPYTNEWAAFYKDTYNEYWSNNKVEGVIRSSTLHTLIEILHKTKGDINNLDQKLNIESE